jgi:hypothetical protein
MANDAYTQQALAADRRFQQRLENALGKVAWEVLNEDPAALHHTERAQYANRVINAPQQTASQLASSFVGRPNIFNFETSYNFTVGGTITAAGDADIESQLHTDWNFLAGVITP